MSKTTLSGLVIPTAGDDLLGSWERFSDSIRPFIAVTSVSAARAKLTQLSEAGLTITNSAPVYFDIGGVCYRSDGRKEKNVWVLSPINEVQYAETTYAHSWNSHLASGEASGMMSVDLGVRPYDRLVSVDANIYGYATSGNVDMAVSIGTKMKLARIASGEAHSVSATIQAVVQAGTQPTIAVSIRGGSGGGRAILSADARFNTLTATAQPITMS